MPRLLPVANGSFMEAQFPSFAYRSAVTDGAASFPKADSHWSATECQKWLRYET